MAKPADAQTVAPTPNSNITTQPETSLLSPTPLESGGSPPEDAHSFEPADQSLLTPAAAGTVELQEEARPLASDETHPQSQGAGSVALSKEAGATPSKEAALHDWKDALRRDFELWLESIDAILDLDAEDAEAARAPDLYSFYEELTALSAESRKANRRNAEAVSQWNDVLAQFQADIGRMSEHVVAAAESNSGALPRAHCLALIELLDRARRLAAAFTSPPPRVWWFNDSRWRQAWDTQRQGVEILRSHIEGVLKQEGISRVEVVGKPFDPATMVAVATESSRQHPHQSVTEEIAAGFTLNGELLRLAHVKVALNREVAAR